MPEPVRPQLKAMVDATAALLGQEEGLPVLSIEAPRELVLGGRMDPLSGRMVGLLNNPKPELYLDASWAFFLDG